MAKNRKDIANELLREANFYWYDENEDQVDRIDPETYDPIVDKIFKANSVELEKLYREIDEAKRAVIVGLAQTLVPDQSLLPEPGYTIAALQSKAQRVHTSPEDLYQISGQTDTGKRHDYYFTPLFEHNFPNVKLKAIITENQVFSVDHDQYEVVAGHPSGKSSSVWLGLDIAKSEVGDFISIYPGNRIFDEFDKECDVFLRAEWRLNGTEEMPVRRGIEGFVNGDNKTPENGLLDKLGVVDSYQKQIHNRFRNSFIHINLPGKLDPGKSTTPPEASWSGELDQLDLKDALVWIRLDFSIPIEDDFFVQNHLHPGAIPLVNRRLKEQYVVKSNYDRIVLPMRTTDHFLDVHQVQDSMNREDGTSYQRVNFLHPESEPGSYVVRGGSRIRRLNREDATRQMHHVMEVIRDEYNTFKEEGVNRLREDFDIIEKALNRIKTQLPEYFREDKARESYFAIAYFRPGINRLRYSYWETQGELIKHLGDKINLEVTSGDVRIINSKTIVPIQTGRSELSSDDYINQLKISLLSKGRIQTKADIRQYCRSHYGHYFKVSSIERQLMMVQEGELGRGILVTLIPKTILTIKEGEMIRLQFQNDLNAKSNFFTHIKVEIANAH